MIHIVTSKETGTYTVSSTTHIVRGIEAMTQADAVRMDIVLGQEPILGTVERK